MGSEKVFRHFYIALVLCLGLTQVARGQSCEAYVYKSHTWSHGYVAKLYLDMSWLTSSTMAWSAAITFNNQVKEYKVWDADISGTSKNYVTDAASVTVTNKCYNPILYSCQFLELSFLVRFPDDISDEDSTDYDISNVDMTVTLSDDSTSTNAYSSVCTGQPTTPTMATTTA